jgi:uncharacterized protein
MLAFIRRNSLVVFFFLAYLFTWARWLPEAAADRGWIAFEVPFWLELLAGYGPLLAAVLVTALAVGRGGLKDLGTRLVRWRVGPLWYLVIFGLPILLHLAGRGLAFLVTGQPVVLAAGAPPLLELLSFFPLLILGFDGLGEEVGWRGFALPALLKRHSPLAASLILGLLWGFWHLPYSLTSGSFLADVPFVLVVANTLGLGILHTWVFTHARASILIAILFHAWNNIVSILLLNWLPVPGGVLSQLAMVSVLWVVAALVVFILPPFEVAQKLRARQPRVGPTL